MRGLILAACFATAAVCPEVASAATYEVRACGASSVASSFVAANNSPTTLEVAQECPASPGSWERGLTVRALPGTANTVPGARASWTITAPDGTRLRRLAVDRWLGRRSDNWKVEVVTAEAPGAPLEDCPLTGTQRLCSVGGTSTDSARVYDNLSTRSVSFVVRCETDLFCANGLSQTVAWVSLSSASATVEDSASPTLNPLSGDLLGPGWHRGTGTVAVAASDASGISYVSVGAAGATLVERAKTCDYTRMQPCPASVSETFAVDTSRLPDGVHQLRVVAADAAKQEAVATGTLRIDAHAPTAPTGLVAQAQEDGTYSFTWSTPGQGGAAPIVRAHYQVCDALGTTCSDGVGTKADRLDGVVVPTGPHQVRVWLEDEAGNADPAAAAVVTVGSGSVGDPQVVGTNPPVLLPSGPAPSPQLRVIRARRTGNVLEVSGTVAAGVSAPVTARLSRTKQGRSLVSARTTPRRGKWTARLKVPQTLSSSRSVYLTLTFAGQGDAYRKSAIVRRLARKPVRSGSTAVEFSVETR